MKGIFPVFGLIIGQFRHLPGAQLEYHVLGLVQAHRFRLAQTQIVPPEHLPGDTMGNHQDLTRLVESVQPRTDPRRQHGVAFAAGGPVAPGIFAEMVQIVRKRGFDLGECQAVPLAGV